MGHDPFDPALDPLPRRVIAGLSKISLALRHREWQEAGERGLTPTQGQILALLGLRPRVGVRLLEIADGLAVTPPTASDALQSLAGKGLVRKRRSAKDSRSLAATLTERGRREAVRAATWLDSLTHAFVVLDEREQEAFFKLLLKMIRGLQERGLIKVARMCVTCRFFQPNVHRGSERPHHCAFVDAPLGDHHLRLECPDQEPALPERAARAWATLFP